MARLVAESRGEVEEWVDQNIQSYMDSDEYEDDEDRTPYLIDDAIGENELDGEDDDVRSDVEAIVTQKVKEYKARQK